MTSSPPAVRTRARRGTMMSVRVEEAEYFNEEDEDPKEVFAVFDAGEKGRTAPPDAARGARPWQVRLRFGRASGRLGRR